MDVEPPAYVVDTSTWIRLRGIVAVPGVWGRLDGLVTAGRLIVPQEVIFEIEGSTDDLAKWLREQESCHRTTAELWNAAQVVADRYPDLVNYAKPGSADCFVVAAAIIERDTPVLLPREAIVIANESRRAPDRICLPDACDREGLRCFDLTGWFNLEGWAV
jgi:hypothetical protein